MKKHIKIASLSFVGLLFLVSLFFNVLKFTQADEMSEIQLIEVKALEYKTEAEKQKSIRDEAQRLFEQATWGYRCMEKKITIEGRSEDCTQNLERFASFQ